MRIAALSVVTLLLTFCALAQAPATNSPDTTKDIQLNLQDPIKPAGAVPVSSEPHHAHVFQNGYVRVYNVTVPPLDATLLHQHDLPYIYLTLGTTDVVNAVQGKPEARMMLEDGTTRYSPGGFAHIARTDAGVAFHNITIELVHPQESPRNLGEHASERPLGSCPQNGMGQKQDRQIPLEQDIPCFETSELRMDLVKVDGGRDYTQASPGEATLLIAVSNASLEVSLGGEHVGFLHGGDVQWLPAGVAWKVADFLGTRSEFLLISFKDSGAAAK
ncbi:MAG TPA: hypothetical protein VKP61_04915 [Candidatus Acidoferrum sp.]|nr:hypothetical protein [Candidatus Acidoferrum sp.]